MEMSTGTLRGTPRTECSGDIAGCSENYTILVYATDDSTKSLLVENFTLSLSYKVVAGIDHINGSGGIVMDCTEFSSENQQHYASLNNITRKKVYLRLPGCFFNKKDSIHTYQCPRD